MNKVCVRGQRIYFYRPPEPIPKSQVNFSRIEFDMDETWGSFLSVVAQFIQGGEPKNVKVEYGYCFVPSELEVGAFELCLRGDDGESVVASVNRLTFEVCEGFDPSGETPLPPSPDLYAQLIKEIDSGKKIAQSVREDADAGLFNGKRGADGGWYTPLVTQTDENTLRMAFTPSKEDMPAVADTDITLPSGGGGNNIQSDWNQNDDTQPDYVKNRPFYTGDPVETVLVEESTPEFFEHNDAYAAEFPSTFEATVGETYKVFWDGTTYECSCVVVDEVSFLFIGNLSIADLGSDTGEPFVMAVSNGEGMLIFTRDTSDSHTISISRLVREAVKLDEKYLPENIATKSDVEAAQTTANNAQSTANNAQSAANAALAKFPLKYSDVVDTPFSAIEFPGEVTTYSRSSAKGGTFIKLTLSGTSDLTGSGFYKVSSDVFDFEDLCKISYKLKYSSGASSNLISVDDLEPKVNFSSDHSVFLLNRDILFCGSTGTFTITINRRTQSFSVAETGIYSYTSMMSSSHSFVNYIELTKKEIGFIQSSKPVLIPSSTEGSTKKFRITVDDSGTISVTEMV